MFLLFKFHETNDNETSLFWIRSGQKIYHPKNAPVENPTPASGMIEGEVAYETIHQGVQEMRERRKAHDLRI